MDHTSSKENNVNWIAVKIPHNAELRTNNNRNALVARIFQGHNGFNAVINKSVEVQIGITYNVLDLITQIVKTWKISTLPVMNVKEKILMVKVEEVKLEKESKVNKVVGDRLKFKLNLLFLEIEVKHIIFTPFLS